MVRSCATLFMVGVLGCNSPPPARTAPDDSIDCRALSEGNDNPLWQSLLDAPYTHPNLPNVSFAGYRYGAGLPDNNSAARIDVTDHGARPNTDVDASDAIDAAINAVPAEGGVVYFPPGEYRLSRPIFVTRSHVVLQGAGADETRLLFTRSLTDGYATNLDPLGKSRWSWTGGMVWFTPRTERKEIRGGDVSQTWTEGWTTLDASVGVMGDNARGATSIRVENTSDLAPAQLMLIELDASVSLHKHLAGDGAFADAQDWSLAGAGAILPPMFPVVQWPVTIAEIEGDVITLAQPLRFDLRPEWAPRLRAVAQVITESGVRDLSVVLGRNTIYDRDETHLKEAGWNGVLIENALHCFVSNVNVIDSESAIGVVSSKNITVRAFSIESSDDAHSAQHHGTVTRLFSNDVLFEDFTIASQPLHGINIEGFSMGNVWSRGSLEHGTWDSHRMLPVENVVTELVIHNDGSPGGRADAGPRMGARQAVWNVRVTNDNCNMLGAAGMVPSGAIVGLRGCTPTAAGDSDCVVVETNKIAAPLNLYEAERAARLCSESP